MPLNCSRSGYALTPTRTLTGEDQGDSAEPEPEAEPPPLRWLMTADLVAPHRAADSARLASAALAGSPDQRPSSSSIARWERV